MTTTRERQLARQLLRLHGDQRRAQEDPDALNLSAGRARPEELVLAALHAALHRRDGTR